MTLNQLHSLDEPELDMLLYIVNVLFPIESPKIEFDGENLTWIKDGYLNNKLINASQHIKSEYSNVYISLVNKLGLQVELKTEPSGSISGSKAE